MPRSRNIKPGFFTNDRLAEIHPLGRLLFAGLWALADREGRLEDRPKKIKAEVLPYDDCNTDELLGALSDQGFIQRYATQGAHYIQIVKWKKHQNPHIKEAPSAIPAPCLNGATAGMSGACQADSGYLIPDCGLPNVDALPVSPGGDMSSAIAERPATAASSPSSCPHEKIIDLFHSMLPMCPRIKQWTSARRKHLTARWRELPKRQNLEYWGRVFQHIGESKFLIGCAPSRDGRVPFLLTLGWLVKPENFAKVIEGYYHGE